MSSFKCSTPFILSFSSKYRITRLRDAESYMYMFFAFFLKISCLFQLLFLYLQRSWYKPAPWHCGNLRSVMLHLVYWNLGNFNWCTRWHRVLLTYIAWDGVTISLHHGFPRTSIERLEIFSLTLLSYLLTDCCLGGAARRLWQRDELLWIIY